MTTAVALLVVAALLSACAGKVRENGPEATTATHQALVAIPGVGPLLLEVSKTSCASNQAQDSLQVTNNESASIPLSQIALKYWINDTSGQNIVPHVWYGGCVTSPNGTCVHPVEGVTIAAVAFPGCGPDPSERANWEITVTTTDAASIAPGQTWSDVQTAVNLANFSNFSPGTVTWYSTCGTGQPLSFDPHFGVYVGGQLVPSFGIAAPDCRAPHGPQQLSGYLTPAIAAAPIIGPVPAPTVLPLAIGLNVQDPAALAAQARAVSDPQSPTFHQYVSESVFETTVSPTAAHYQQLIAWAQSVGLTVTQQYPNRLLLDVTGTVPQIEAALFSNVVTRRRPDGTQFFALDREPSLQLSPTDPVFRISGLDNLILATQGGSAPNGFDDTIDLRTAYASCAPDFPSGGGAPTLTGANQSLGLFELDGFTAGDITKYECTTGLVRCDPTNTIILSGSVPTITPVLIDGASGTPTQNANGTPSNGASEVTADIEVAVAMAPGLSNVFVFMGPNSGTTSQWNDVLNAMLARTDTNQFSSSWFFAVDSNTQTILSSMALKGQSFFQASGDQGSSSWSNDPGDIRDADDVVVVGGTTLSLGVTPSNPMYHYLALLSRIFVHARAHVSGGATIPNAACPVDTLDSAAASTSRRARSRGGWSGRSRRSGVQAAISSGRARPCRPAVGGKCCIRSPMTKA